jgi:hypothetical protein
MTAQDDAVRLWPKFLELEMATENDARLVSLVEYWTLGTQIYQTFGIDSEQPLSAEQISALRRHNINFDRIRADWTERFSVNRFVGNYPRKGVGLNYHFGRLYLHSHAFRGICDSEYNKRTEISLELDEICQTAVFSAISVIRSLVSDAETAEFWSSLPTVS